MHTDVSNEIKNIVSEEIEKELSNIKDKMKEIECRQQDIENQIYIKTAPKITKLNRQLKNIQSEIYLLFKISNENKAIDKLQQNQINENEKLIKLHDTTISKFLRKSRKIL